VKPIAQEDVTAASKAVSLDSGDVTSREVDRKRIGIPQVYRLADETPR
jgi:hypothetical protein